MRILFTIVKHNRKEEKRQEKKKKKKKNGRKKGGQKAFLFITLVQKYVKQNVLSEYTTVQTDTFSV